MSAYVSIRQHTSAVALERRKRALSVIMLIALERPKVLYVNKLVLALERGKGGVIGQGARWCSTTRSSLL